MFLLNLLTLQRLQLLTESYLENGEEPFTVDILKEMTSKFNSSFVIVIFFLVYSTVKILAFLFYKIPIFLMALLSFSDICQKLSADVKQREWLVACCTHKVCIYS